MSSPSTEQQANVVNPRPTSRTGMSCLRTRGFTIIETLTVAAICSVCTSLLVPAMQSARRDARDMICVNNLKQLGLTLPNYHDVHGGFPPAWNKYARAGWRRLCVHGMAVFDLTLS
jgi:competence protein ComGC